MDITEADYRSLIDAQRRGDLTIMIDTASFRQLFVRSDSTKFSELIGEAMHTRIALIRTLTYVEILFPLAAMVLSLVALGWWGLLLAPVVFLVWSEYKAFASRGVQRIGPATLFLVGGILIAALPPGLHIWHRVLIIVLSATAFMTRLLYVYTASVVFGLIYSNYVFFKSFFMQREGTVRGLIWTDPDLSASETERERPMESLLESEMAKPAPAALPTQSIGHKERIERANAIDELPIITEALRHRLENDYPHIKQCPGWSDFVMAATVGACYYLALRLHFEVPEDQRTDLELQMRRVLRQRFPRSEAAWESCHHFVTESFAKMSRADRGKYLFTLIAMWVMGVVTDNEQIDDREEITARIAALYQPVMTHGFWSER